MNAAFLFSLLCTISIAAEPLAKPEPYPLIPFGASPIDYWSTTTADPVERLKHRMDARELTLAPDERFGLLPALLRELNISPASQILKFASGSPHAVISPSTPRAIYFREDVAVAWFPGTAQIEIAVQDPQHGTHFYTLTTSSDAPPRWERPQQCMACHVGPNTGTNVPGWQLHVGVRPDAVRDHPWQHRLSHAMPFEKRWQQVYLTGNVSTPLPSGKLLTVEPPQWLAGRYLETTSDPAAVLIRDHWLLGMNLLTRWSFEHQTGKPSDQTTAALVRYLMMTDEVPLPLPIPAATPFTKTWLAEAKRDSVGRTLRDLDLQTRTFRYAVSPLLLTRMVQDQPRERRWALYRAIRDGLDSTKSAQVQETLAVLAATVPDWPTDFSAGLR